MSSSFRKQAKIAYVYMHMGTVFFWPQLWSKKCEFRSLYEVRDDLGQGTVGGTKNRALTPKDVMNQNENL